MALILRYVDLRVVGFVLIYVLATSRRPAAAALGAKEISRKRKKRKGKEKGKEKEKEKEREKEIK